MGVSILARMSLTIPRGEGGLWAIMRELDAAGPWTIADIDRAANTNKGTISDYVKRLRLGGFVEEVGERAHPRRQFGPSKLYKIARPVILAPRLKADGSETPEADIEKIWRALKMSRDFSAREIVTTLNVDGDGPSLQTIRSYLLELHKVGVIARSDGGPRGKFGGGTVEARYRLVRNIGALAPKILSSKIVFDPNAEKVLGATLAGGDAV